MFKKYHSLYILVAVGLLLSGCAAPKQAYVPVETIVAATYAAISAQTAAARPPNTPTPLPPTATHRPGTATPLPSATFVLSTFTPFATSTSTPEPTATNVISGSGTAFYICNILSISPENVYRVKANQDFTWAWQIENIGTTVWEPDSAKFVYMGGAQLSNKTDVRLNDRTKPGQITYFSIKMHAPREPGTYTTTWAMRKNIHTFCYAKLKIEVYQ